MDASISMRVRSVQISWEKVKQLHYLLLAHVKTKGVKRSWSKAFCDPKLVRERGESLALNSLYLGYFGVEWPVKLAMKMPIMATPHER